MLVSGAWSAEDAVAVISSLPTSRDASSADALLSGIARLLVSERAPRRVLEGIADALASLVPHDTLVVHRADEVLMVLQPVLARGTAATGVGSAIPLADGAGPAGFAAASRAPVEADGILAVPLVAGGSVLGTLSLGRDDRAGSPFSEDEAGLVRTFGDMAALAIENARLFAVERESAETSRALLELSEDLARLRRGPDVLARAVEAMAALLGRRAAGVWLREQDGAFRLAHHRGLAGEPGSLDDHRVSRAAAASLFGPGGEPFVLAALEPELLPQALSATAPPSEVLVAPMRWEPDGAGAFAVLGEPDRGSFRERDLRLARGVAGVASLAIGNAERAVDLERAYLSTAEALASALEAKDEYTSDHARALAEMSIAVGDEMGMGGEELRRLELGALFHDIGKIGVSSEIIRKPGPLSAEERREMNRHPEIGEEILTPMPFLQEVRPIVRACHERWDGGGYPDGLAREAIPIEARVVFVCDAFHAMTSDRPYRGALPEEEALRRLRTAAGTQFDPSVVGAFLRAHGSGAIRAAHPR